VKNRLFSPITSVLPVIRTLSGSTSYADIGAPFETVDECEFEEMEELMGDGLPQFSFLQRPFGVQSWIIVLAGFDD
jgi:hypothetical protein